MAKKIGYVPLDDRPCNLKFPQKLAAISGIELLTPPAGSLGHFRQPGDPDVILAWLKETAPKVDSLIISSEMLCYGGLIASRRSSTGKNTAMNRLEALKEIRKSTPNVGISFFSLVLRNSPVADLDVDEALWKKIFKYSELTDKVESFSLMDDKVSLGVISKEIPGDVLQSYLAVRERNHDINLKAVELIKEGIADFLIIGSDDVALHGLHRMEKRKISELIRTLRLSDRAKIICGADEIGMMLFARAATKVHPKMSVVYSNPGTSEDTMLYEDVPLKVSVAGHVEALGGQIADEKSADIQGFINTPAGKQHDLFLDDIAAITRDHSQFIKEIKKAVDSHKAICLIDVACANGADTGLIEALAKEVDLSKLASFAAWNTASNSIGAALAEAVVKLAKGVKEGESKQLLLERFIDDHLYQSVLRQRIKKDIVYKGVSPFDLGDTYSPVNWVVKEELKRMAIEFISKHFKSFDPKKTKLEIELPWPRIFEVDVEVKSGP
jgi:hypothetical protein